MKKLILALAFAVGAVIGVEAAPNDTVTQADLQAILERLNKLEAENKAQAQRIAELEGKNKELASKQVAAAPAAAGEIKTDEGTKVSESGKVYTTEQGFQYYLADKAAGIFEPLSQSGLKITPYGWLVFEAIHNTHKTEVDSYADWVCPRKNGGHNGDHQTVFTMQDSIMGLEFVTPEKVNGWKFFGRAEFDLAGDHANDYAFHWRHLFVDAQHDSGWSILFGQTWHLWKMVTPSEIDGAWLENTGHPYRRSPQIRVTKTWDFEDSVLEARVGLVKNGPGMGGDRDDDGNQDNSASAWALVEGALLYSRDAAWEKEGSGKRWTVGVGGMYGRDKSHRPDGVDADGNWTYGGQSDEYDSKMLMFAASVPFGDFTLCGQIFGGDNLGGVQAGVGQRVGFSDIGRKGHTVRTVGGFVDLNWRPSDTWEFAVGYGFDNPNDNDARRAEHRTFNDRAYIDAFYHITSNFKLGFEYARLSTKYDNAGDGKDDRFEFAAFYDF